ncbi:MAG: hypothetical protein JWQ87_4558 [Candidatus Sulfotelmatobacter sp.]|nr:hypothetical protein [Candidatus Sulfotelmatobacter sp.]
MKIILERTTLTAKLFTICTAVIQVVVLFFILPALHALDHSSSPPNTNNFDGPAELPREYVKSSIRDTPAAGKTWTVQSAKALEKSLADAACGDILQLQAGATFAGKFVLPAKNCDDSHWIILRTSAPDSALPKEGLRLTPCYAGVSSLPGRPPWVCASATNVMAKIEGTGSIGPLLFAPGANHYRLIGLELTRNETAGAVYDLVQFMGKADHLIFDRLWFHGTAHSETVRGILLGATRYVAVVDSFFTDFHCVSRTGSCGDAQAIAGGLGDDPMGPYKIVNNFLEASGENFMLGGGGAGATPADIQISRNHMFKPLSWLKGQPGYVGGADGNPFIVKNLLELKNAQRILVEGNIMENTWGGFSQVGFAIVLTPKNPGRTSQCSVCQVTDVTIRYNSILHVGAGLQIANALSDYGAAARGGQRYSIHDITIDDMDSVKYIGDGEFAQLSVTAGAPLLQNVTINHVTAFPTKHLLIVGDVVATSQQMKNVVFTNNIFSVGTYPVWSTGGGPANCAFHDSPLTTWTACFVNSNFSTNVIIGAPAGPWPPNNFFPASAAAVKFVNYNGGKNGDYRLQPSSPYRGKGTDGKDLGADVNAILGATAGVD